MDVTIDYDIETFPLQILTETEISEGSLIFYKVNIHGENQDGETVGGGVWVLFSDPPRYKIGPCTPYITFANIPAENTRLWTIKKTTTSVALVCNGVDIFYHIFSESTWSRCVPKWGQRSTKIKFLSSVTENMAVRVRRKPTGSVILNP